MYQGAMLAALPGSSGMDDAAPPSRSAAARRATVGRRVLLVRMPARVDGAAATALDLVARGGRRPGIDRLVLDMQAVAELTDTWLAHLLALHAVAGRLRDHIHLANLHPAVAARMRDSGVSWLFHLDVPSAGTPGSREGAPVGGAP